MILLARTTPLADVVKRKSEGMSIFIVDLRDAIGHGLTVRPIRQHGEPRDQRAVLREPGDPGTTTSSAQEGQGFKYILDGLNAERTLIAAECIGDGLLVHRPHHEAYAEVTDVVFGRPIGQNQARAVPHRRERTSRSRRPT